MPPLKTPPGTTQLLFIHNAPKTRSEPPTPPLSPPHAACNRCKPRAFGLLTAAAVKCDTLCVNKQDVFIDTLSREHKSPRLDLSWCVFVHISQVGMYHDPHIEDGATSGDGRMIFTESMPRRVGSFYRGEDIDETLTSETV